MATDFAAGGVVVREHQGAISVLMITDRFGFLTMPKGHAEADETWEQAALREVFEETGVLASVLSSLEDLEYEYRTGDGKTVRKIVRYFLMIPIGGDLTPQPGETLGCEWIEASKLPTAKTYEGTRPYLSKAIDLYRLIVTKL